MSYKRIVIDLASSIQRTGLPLIEVIVSNVKRMFILDSGASTNLVSSSLGEQIGATIVGAGTTFSFEGNVADLPIIQLCYSLGRESHIANFTITDSSTFNVFEVESGIKVVGIMGIPFLIAHKCLVDFAIGQLSLIP